MPFLNDSFDCIYSGGVIHHTVTEIAFKEINRVLKKGGKFSAVDPFKMPFYDIGTKIFGKREIDVFCRPIDKKRIKQFEKHFKNIIINYYGLFFRYFVIALEKIGISFSNKTVRKIQKFDKIISNLLPFTKNKGSSIVFCGCKK